MIESPGSSICSQTHPFESIFILTVLVLQVIDLGLEVFDLLMKLEDGLPDVVSTQLMVTGELRDHQVVGVESTFHHPLTLENKVVRITILLYDSTNYDP